MHSVYPTAPAPPGRLTTTTAFPRYFPVVAAKALKIRSGAPPAAQGMMIWTSLSGKAAAWSGKVMKTNEKNRQIMRPFLNMILPPFLLLHFEPWTLDFELWT